MDHSSIKSWPMNRHRGLVAPAPIRCRAPGSGRLVEAARIELASEAASRKTSTSVVPDLISPWRLPWNRIRQSQSR